MLTIEYNSSNKCITIISTNKSDFGPGADSSYLDEIIQIMLREKLFDTKLCYYYTYIDRREYYDAIEMLNQYSKTVKLLTSITEYMLKDV